MEIKLSIIELGSVKESGTNLRTQRASAIAAGIYDVVEIINFEVQSREDIISILEEKGKDASWCSNLPDSNVKGLIRLSKDGGVVSSYYLNNQLFNLIIEQNVVEIKDIKKNNKIVEQSYELN